MTNSDRAGTSLRFDPILLAAIDARAQDVGLSRNAWIEKCTKWAIHNLPFGATGPVRREAALNAPHDVAGEYAVDMGLDNIEGKPTR